METRVENPWLRRVEEEYLGSGSWEVRENANENTSFTNLLSYILDKTLKKPEVLSTYLPGKAVEMHFSGSIHIHKLPASLWSPYCTGVSYGKLLRTGLKTPTVWSRPAKHLDTAVNHLANLFFLLSQEFTGACATSAFDLYAAPFVAADGLDRGRVRQALQSMLFELNYPSRTGFQSPFSNLTLVMASSPGMLEMRGVVAGREVDPVSGYLDEVFTVCEELLALYLEGDARGRPFTFPIPTVMITRHFDWTGRRWGGVVDLLFRALARRGTAYLLNGYATDAEQLYSMCCRLTLDLGRLNGLGLVAGVSGGQGPRGVWAMPDATGSIGVVTINLVRAALLSKGEDSTLFEILDSYLEAAREVLLAWRRRYAYTMQRLMPVARVYLGHLNAHFSTFGLVGLPEAAAVALGDPGLWTEGSRRDMWRAVQWMKTVVRHVRMRCGEYEAVDGYLYNVEEVPAESCAYRLAQTDKRRFRQEASWLPNVYSNSIVPYYADLPIYERARMEGEVQQEFTGGVMMHLFLGEHPDPDALRRLVERIVKQARVVYFSITPAQSFCQRCGWGSVGVQWECPRCGSETEVWSRIVGYYRPLRSWNPGRQKEFRMRKHYFF